MAWYRFDSRVRTGWRIGFDPAATTVGTGLANLRDRIESAGGTLTVEPAPGGGTRISAGLPAQELSAPVAVSDGVR